MHKVNTLQYILIILSRLSQKHYIIELGVENCTTSEVGRYIIYIIYYIYTHKPITVVCAKHIQLMAHLCRISTTSC